MGQQHISYQALLEKSMWFEEKIRKDPDVETVTMVTGTSGGGFGGNSAQINVQLKPVGVRKSTSDQVIARIRRKTRACRERSCSCRTPGRARGRPSGQRAVSVHHSGARLCFVIALGAKAAGQVVGSSGDCGFSSDQQVSGLSSNVIIDRDTASRLGLTAQAVDSALYDAFGQRQVSAMYKSINQYHVVLALQQQWWKSPDFLKTVYVQTPKGTDVPLSTFTHFTQGITPISLPHQGQFPASTISFNLAEGVP